MPLPDHILAELDILAQHVPAIIIVHQLDGIVLKYMSPSGLRILNTTKEAIFNLPGEEYQNRYFNPDDAADYTPKLIQLLEKGDETEFVTFFQQVRSSPEDDYKWYFTTTKIFMKNAEGKPTHIISYAQPIDPSHHLTSKVSRLLEENNFLIKNHARFAKLTKREIEILKCMALGENSDLIAQKLFISEATVNTHRKNIRTKLNATTHYDLVQFAHAFDLI